MSFVLLGADGQVGFELHRALAPLGAITATTRSGKLPGGAECVALDITDTAAIVSMLRAARPRWIVNAAAYTAVDRAEDELAQALLANAQPLEAIGAVARELDAAVVHYSTDYVFAGDATRPYAESDPVAPINAYGRSKLAGEEALRTSGARHLLFRTAWVYGSRGRNFLRTMLRLAGERERLTVVDDQRGAPTTARLIAGTTAAVVARGARREAPWGTFHLAAGGETSWHGFAQQIVSGALRAGLIAREPAVDAIRSEDFPTRAKRPHYSVLDTRRLQTGFGLTLPDWRQGLDATLAEIAEARATFAGKLST